ncbi:MAG: hypothetical protein QG646_4038 [Euryarchaeota archaeon]|jgi:divalent metal cation (Fe/Co/Zn/Cd) transporter|nr:hypothetical protein [Euryarchaeota archaeon]
MIVHVHKFKIIALMAFLIMLLGISIPELEIISGILLSIILIHTMVYLRKETVSELLG